MRKIDKTSQNRKQPEKVWRRFRELLLRRLKKLYRLNKELNQKSKRVTIHDIRVLCRRTQGMLSLLKHSPGNFHLQSTQRAVKKMTKLLSPIRSMDVSDGLMRQRLKKLPPPIQERLEFCKKELWELRRQTRGILKKNRPFRFSAGKLALPTSPAKAEWFLPRLLEQLHLAAGKAEKSLIAYETSRDTPKLHEFRIR
ncbi:MAG: CHAD domain-containing protein, partial [Deltaproteobacteria bacterium]|nr:CHAD domain-containing protein [Deltaproteobacteria bacterium]